MGRTLFVCIVLTMGALLFSKDANDLALRPIERMIEKVLMLNINLFLLFIIIILFLLFR